MIKPVVLFIIGLVCLIKGGDWFVDGASALARKFNLPELLIGATVVSIGTTLPEVMVSTMSALSGHGEIAYGNAIGSVICNTALIAAITIAVKPGPADPKTLKVPVAFFYVAAAIYCIAAYAMGRFTRPMGFIMLAVFVCYMIVNVRSMKNSPQPALEGSKLPEVGIGFPWPHQWTWLSPLSDHELLENRGPTEDKYESLPSD
jgi:cation:H+ antiporter